MRCERSRRAASTSCQRDLLDGSGLTLESRGEHELKGLSGARSIFALRR